MREDIIRHYAGIVEFLGNALGPDYEIVLQGLKSNTIVAIANNHISGRVVGSPITDSAHHMLSTKAYKNNNSICNYRVVTKSGKILRSSTMFIKDDEGETVGLLHVNFDDSRFEELRQGLLSAIHPEAFIKNFITGNETGSTASDNGGTKENGNDNLFMDVPALMKNMYQEATENITVPSNRLKQHEKMEIVTRLHEKGLFQLKGAIPFAAEKLSCSSATIYRYLSEITNQ
ncbi:putative transcriptional regulator YheO [Lachnospiraceae bacterium PF1-21]|uniref:PAS domain-containing protein n=1 Tax=Ohessyouella blattaphilus TaxID=2949333 RepID=A0ABT1EPC8_9FIRM|nr:PAS domain-containing protein [Ohessyouella blattaphilus]MCP1111137.1 PAS domain-containing protein [Ohessyouella blattaphilus]MCR8564531.1 PAS domain-containing protein [Ohessyouella blattaphilus]MDL2250218.1 PAS domain-containing protein [Lachnospiraceae bacterium OttesenSCG-928-J05]